MAKIEITKYEEIWFRKDSDDMYTFMYTRHKYYINANIYFGIN